MIEVFAALTAFLFASDIYDVLMTEKGIKKGVAVESFSWLIGQKPSAVALYCRDSVINLLVMAPSAAALCLHSTPWFWAGLAAPAVVGVKHILGGRAWAKLLK